MKSVSVARRSGCHLAPSRRTGRPALFTRIRSVLGRPRPSQQKYVISILRHWQLNKLKCNALTRLRWVLTRKIESIAMSSLEDVAWGFSAIFMIVSYPVRGLKIYFANLNWTSVIRNQKRLLYYIYIVLSLIVLHCCALSCNA
jgi:hypothetical protein